MQRSYSMFRLDLLPIQCLAHLIPIYYHVASNSTANSRFKSDSCEIEIDCSTWNVRRRMCGGWGRTVLDSVQVVWMGLAGKGGTNRNRQIDTGIPLKESNRWRGVRR